MKIPFNERKLSNLFATDSRRTPSVKLFDASIAKPFFALG